MSIKDPILWKILEKEMDLDQEGEETKRFSALESKNKLKCSFKQKRGASTKAALKVCSHYKKPSECKLESDQEKPLSPVRALSPNSSSSGLPNTFTIGVLMQSTGKGQLGGLEEVDEGLESEEEDKEYEERAFPSKMKERPYFKLKNACEYENHLLEITDFSLGKKIGEGTLAKVFKAFCKLNDKYYAIKRFDMGQISQSGLERLVIREKEISNGLRHPNIVRLESHFSDSEYCYMVSELCQEMTLHGLIQKMGKLSLDLTRFYAMEIINALEYCHDRNVIHRDLKPMNILLDSTFHIKLADFNASKRIDPLEVRELFEQSFIKTCRKTNKICSDSESESSSDSSECLSTDVSPKHTHVGTPLYKSPEMVECSMATFGSDLWALGCIVYQCLTGKPLFKTVNHWELKERILNCDFHLPKTMDKHAKDLIEKLMKRNPYKRLGGCRTVFKYSFKALKQHEFFQGMDFKTTSETVPPFSAEERKLYFDKGQNRMKMQLSTIIEKSETHVDVPPNEPISPLKRPCRPRLITNLVKSQSLQYTVSKSYQMSLSGNISVSKTEITMIPLSKDYSSTHY